MDENERQEIENKLAVAVRAAIADGYTIRPRVWVGMHRCCALGAVLVTAYGGPEYWFRRYLLAESPYASAVEEITGLDRDFIAGVISGFDGVFLHPSKGETYSAGHRTGRRLLEMFAKGDELYDD